MALLFTLKYSIYTTLSNKSYKFLYLTHVYFLGRKKKYACLISNRSKIGHEGKKVTNMFGSKTLQLEKKKRIFRATR